MMSPQPRNPHPRCMLAVDVGPLIDGVLIVSVGLEGLGRVGRHFVTVRFDIELDVWLGDC